MPREHAGLQFSQRKSGETEKNFFVILEQMSCFHYQLLLQVEQGDLLVPTQSSRVHKVLFFMFAESMS